jgi:hypothetical protein
VAHYAKAGIGIGVPAGVTIPACAVAAPRPEKWQDVQNKKKDVS